MSEALLPGALPAAGASEMTLGVMGGIDGLFDGGVFAVSNP